MPNFEKEKPINITESKDRGGKERWTFEGEDAWKKAKIGTRVKFRKPGHAGERAGEVTDWTRDKSDGRHCLLVQADGVAEELMIEREWVSAVFDPLFEDTKAMAESWNNAMAESETADSDSKPLRPAGIKKKGQPMGGQETLREVA